MEHVESHMQVISTLEPRANAALSVRAIDTEDAPHSFSTLDTLRVRIMLVQGVLVDFGCR